MNEWIIAVVAVAFQPFDGLMPLASPFPPLPNTHSHLKMSYANSPPLSPPPKRSPDLHHSPGIITENLFYSVYGRTHSGFCIPDSRCLRRRLVDFNEWALLFSVFHLFVQTVFCDDRALFRLWCCQIDFCSYRSNINCHYRMMVLWNRPCLFNMFCKST